MMNLQNIISKLKENDDVTVSKKKVTTKKERKTELFNETFKVLDLFDRERYKRKYSPTYSNALNIYKSYLEKVTTREEYNYIKERIEELEGLSKFDKEVNYIRLPEKKLPIIISNYDKEKAQALNKYNKLVGEKNKIDEDIKALLKKRDSKLDEVKEVEAIMDTAKFLMDFINIAKENNNLISLDRHLNDTTGFHIYSSLRGNYKPYVYYEEIREVK